LEEIATDICGLTLELSGRCHSGRQITVARRSGPLDRIVRWRQL